MEEKERFKLLYKKQKELVEWKNKRGNLCDWLNYLAHVSQLRCVFDERAERDGSFKEMKEIEENITKLNKEISELEKELDIE